MEEIEYIEFHLNCQCDIMRLSVWRGSATNRSAECLHRPRDTIHRLFWMLTFGRNRIHDFDSRAQQVVFANHRSSGLANGKHSNSSEMPSKITSIGTKCIRCNSLRTSSIIRRRSISRRWQWNRHLISLSSQRGSSIKRFYVGQKEDWMEFISDWLLSAVYFSRENPHTHAHISNILLLLLLL